MRCGPGSHHSPRSSSPKPRTRTCGPYAITIYAHFWNFQLDVARHAFQNHPPERRLQVRYEDIRTNPVQLFQQVAAFADLGLTPEQCAEIVDRMDIDKVPDSEKGADKPIQSGRVGGYQDEFSKQEVKLMTGIMAPTLRTFGYEA